MNCTLNLSSIGSITAERFRVIGTMNTAYLTIFIKVIACAGNKISLIKSYLIAYKKTSVLLDRLNHKVIFLNPQFFWERHYPWAVFRMIRVIFTRNILCFILRIIVNNKLKRINNSHCSWWIRTEVITNASLKQCKVDNAVSLWNTDSFTKITDCLSRITASSHTADCCHTRVIPAVNNAVLNKL